MSAGIFHPTLAWSEHFQPAPDLPEPPPYPRESSQRAPANARAGQHGRHVSRPVTDQRHGLTRQCGEDHFTRRPVGHMLTGNRIDDFEKQIAFAQMVPLFPSALDPAAVACLSEAVVIENLTMPAVDKRFFQILRQRFRARQNGPNSRGGRMRTQKTAQLSRRGDQTVRAMQFQFPAKASLFSRGISGDAPGSDPGQCPDEQIRNPIGAFRSGQ